jgi:hypothetical protein
LAVGSGVPTTVSKSSIPGFYRLDLHDLRAEYLDIDDVSWLDEFVVKMNGLTQEDTRVRYKDSELDTIHGIGKVVGVDRDGWLQVSFNDLSVVTLSLTDDIDLYSPLPFKPWLAAEVDRVRF